jgi:hypothetical protein
MRTLESVKLDADALSADLSALESLLAGSKDLKERDHILPFFKQHPHLCAAIGLTNSAVELPDRWASELDLFGDFVCDAAAGDSEANAYTLIEFEDALENSIFAKLAKGKSMRRWSWRFERGMSQLVDWAWRLSAEGGSSAALRRIFGDDNPAIHLLLIVGRDAGLRADDLTRLRWRTNHTFLGQFRVSCFTFDGILNSIRRRRLLTAQPTSNF